MLDADSVRKLVAPYVSNLDRDVFAVFGLPEEVIAVLFAYYSRSRNDLRQNLGQLLRDEDLGLSARSPSSAPVLESASEKARAFHEKWVVGYGHASVAEHAVVHLAVENVSIIASKVIEDMRLGSFTEKSTRYVVFDTHSFVDLPHLPEQMRNLYRANGEQLFSTYLALLPRVEQGVRQRVPRAPTQSERAYDAAVRSTTCDLLRGLLPAGTRTNLGITANARALESLFSKMLSSPLDEVRTRGEQMLSESRSVVPTLLKYAALNPYRQRSLTRPLPASAAPSSPRAQQPAQRAAEVGGERAGVLLLDHDRDALRKVARALLYDLGGGNATSGLTEDSLRAAVNESLAQRGKWDSVPRAFEAAQVTLELTLDYGAYRDMQRHRMLSPFAAPLSCDGGATVPPELVEMSLDAPYREALDRAASCWRAMTVEYPHEAAYAVPLAFRVNALWVSNLRELIHVIELRSARQGHPSYRAIAIQMHQVLVTAYPWLADLVRVDLAQYALTRNG